MCAGYEVMSHATGRYPDWWDGKRFTQPTMGWVGNSSFEQVRDNPQRVLLGRGSPAQWGTGMIRKSDILDYSLIRSGSPDCCDVVWVQHASGGRSMIKFKAYEQGRQRWQGETLNYIWCDEEPPEDVYGEALRRLAVLKGLMMITMTPLLGMTEVVGYFHPEPNMQRRSLVMMDITEAEHYTPEEAEEEIQAMKPHERAARARGEPMLGSGRIFPVADEAVVVDWFSVPQSWPRVIELDIGYDHPTAAVLMAIDRENDRMYLIDEYSQTEEIVTVHAAALKPWGEYPIAWPHDGYEHSKDSGLAIADLYRNEGLKMWHEHATFPPVPGKKTGGYGLQAGLDEMLDRMRTNRFKVFSNCTKWLQEFRTYHRKDGKVVKLRDDLISASRIAMMMRRIARTHDVYRRPPPPMLSDWNPSEA